MQSRDVYINVFKKLNIQESILDQLSMLFFDSTELKANDVVKLLCSVDTLDPALKCAQIISEALKVNQTLVKVGFCCTMDIPGGWKRIYIGHTGAQFIAEMLKINKTVRIIDLSYNKIGDLGAQYLAGALKHNRNVQEIDLSSNEINTAGFKSLSAMLEINRSLKVIDLGNQYPGDEGIKYLAKALNNNDEIPTIRMWQSAIGEKGLKQLVDTFDNKPIQYLVKQASIFSCLKIQIGSHNKYGGVNEQVDKLPLTQKVQFWNKKIECYNKYFFNEPVQQRENPPSLLDCTTHYIRSNLNIYSTTDLNELPLELQERLGLFNKDLKFALYAFSNIQCNNLKDDFLKYLSDNNDAYSHAALGVYFTYIDDTENAIKYLTLSIEMQPDALEQFILAADHHGMIDQKTYAQIISSLEPQTNHMACK